MLSREGPQRCALGSKQPHMGVKDGGAEQGKTPVTLESQQKAGEEK